MARVASVGSVALVYGLALPVCAQTPSLADIAEKETERRAALDERSKVYTDDDLHGGLRLTTGGITPEAETDSSPPPDEVIPPTDDTQLTPESDVSARDEEYWRDRITSAREDRRRAALVAAALQNRIDGLWAEFTARDDPLQRSELEQNRHNALQELQRTEVEVDHLDQEILDIQEEARRSGVPPGWLR